MRTKLTLALVVTGCTSWQRTAPSALSASDTALVATTDEAIVMRVECSDDEVVRGQQLQRWTYGPKSVRTISAPGSPSQVAKANGWEPSTSDERHIEIPRANIRGAEVRQTDHTGVALGSGAIGFVLGAAVVFGAFFVEGMNGG